MSTLFKKAKISLVGAGNIGGTIAYNLALKSFADIVLLDIEDGIPKGKALDIKQACASFGCDANIIGTKDYSDIENSDVIVVTAGVPRKPGMSRDDLLDINAKIIDSVAKNISQYSPDSLVIVITNPLDAMVHLMNKALAGNSQKVVGMAGVLDTGRFVTFLAEELGVSTNDIGGFILGGHGDLMVPCIEHCTVGGTPLQHYVDSGKISQEKLDAIVDRTKTGGGEIVSLLKTGSAFYAPAQSAVKMIESFLFDRKQILPCAALLNGEYGYNGIYAGVPCIIGKDGVEKVIDLPLKESTKEDFDKSVKSVSGLIEVLAKMGYNV